MESFPPQGNTPPPEPEKTPESVPVQPEAKKEGICSIEHANEFDEKWWEVAGELGYEVKDGENGKFLEKDGQIINLRHTFFPATGDTVYSAIFEYKDTPRIKPATMQFYHRGELNDKEIKKTFKEQLKKYSKRYDESFGTYPEIKAFNEKWMATAQEYGFTAVKSNPGRVTIENDRYNIKMQHMLYPETEAEDVLEISTLDVMDKTTGKSTISVLEWNPDMLDELIKERFGQWQNNPLQE